MPIELRVDYDCGGHRTLRKRCLGERDWEDVTEPELTANSEPVKFYKQTARYVGFLASKGAKVFYTDET